MSMVISGCSCIGSFGDTQTLAARLTGANSAPAAGTTDLAALSRYVSPRALRQCDHFSRLALLGAYLALEDAGLSAQVPENCGIVLATGYGPASPTFDFLNSLLDFGEGMASPLAFSLSVHNIPAAIIAKNLELVGPCATVCQFDGAAASGLMLAQEWLAEGRVEQVLFGAVEEHTAVLEFITAQMRNEREKARRPANRRDLPLHEGAAFFLLRGEGEGKGRMETVTLEYTGGAEQPLAPADDEELLLLSGTFPAPDRTGTEQNDAPLFGNTAFGNIPIGLALNCATALHMMQRGRHARAVHCGSGTRSSVRLVGM